MAYCAGRIGGLLRFGAGRPVHQFAAAIGATVIVAVSAIGAEGAFERANERARRLGRQICAACLAIGPHLQHGLARGLCDRVANRIDKPHHLRLIIALSHNADDWLCP